MANFVYKIKDPIDLSPRVITNKYTDRHPVNVEKNCSTSNLIKIRLQWSKFLADRKTGVG